MLNSGNQTNICASLLLLFLPHTHTLTHIHSHVLCVWGIKIKCAGFKRALGLHIHKHIEETDIGFIGFVFLVFALLLFLTFFAMISALFTHHYINFCILLFTLMNLFKFHEIFNSYLLLLFLFCFLFFLLCSCECVFVFHFWYIIYLVFINVSFRSKNLNTQICFDVIF